VTEFWARRGISASLLCALHCLLTPFLVLLAPILDRWLNDPRFHWVIALIVFPVAAWALWHGYRKHHLHMVLVLGAIGLALMAFGMDMFSPTQISSFEAHESGLKIFAMVAAGVTLASAHYLNLRECRRHPRTLTRP
jgi:hypothetical protein